VRLAVGEAAESRQFHTIAMVTSQLGSGKRYCALRSGSKTHSERHTYKAIVKEKTDEAQLLCAHSTLSAERAHHASTNKGTCSPSHRCQGLYADKMTLPAAVKHMTEKLKELMVKVPSILAPPKKPV
jgi:type II secretory pathway predicted ATPase ExeA